jgi:hypothetical protein
MSREERSAYLAGSSNKDRDLDKIDDVIPVLKLTQESSLMFGIGKRMKFIVSLLAIGLSLSSTISIAATKKKKRKKKPVTWAFEQTYKLLGTVQEASVAKELTNPDNQFYQLPERSILIEFRPELQGSYKRSKLVLRPRASVSDDFRNIPALNPAPPGYKAPKDQEVKSDAFLNEAYLAGTPSGKWQYVLGLQNFQWGPAELASPSNPIFRDLGLSKTYFFETRGKGILRANYSPSGQTTIIGMGEVFDSNSKRNASDPNFRKKALIKAEFADKSQTNYIGGVISVAEDDKPIYGSYAHYEVAPGFTVYYDMQARKSSRIWQAEVSPLGLSFQQSLTDADKLSTAALAGVRYTTEGNIDYRVEGFYEDSAWTKKQRNLGRAVLALAPTADNAAIYLTPGSFFSGQKFVYVSARIPEIGWKDSLTVSLRDLYSVTDQTQKLQISLDTFFGDSIIMSTGATASVGAADGELTQGYSWQAFVTTAWSF